MQLAVHRDDADILLKEKNNLTEGVLDKYRVAGQIAQTGLKYIISLINNSYHYKTVDTAYTLQELCILGDSMLSKLLSKAYNNEDKVREKGIAFPTCIEVDEFVSGFSPELDDVNDYTFQPGDVVTITLGAHIDGYTANISHTIVIYPPGAEVDGEIKPSGPLLGDKADSLVASHIATEAVIALLGLSLTPEKISSLPGLASSKVVTGTMIREMVNTIAESFNCVVVPGSKVRRVRRFLAGQAEGIVEESNFKGVIWDESDQEKLLIAQTRNSQELVVKTSENSQKSQSSAIPTDDFIIEDDEVYNVDIKMAAKNPDQIGVVTLEEIDEFSGKNNKDKQFNSKSTIFIRDFAINHQLKLRNSHKLLNTIDKKFSVYPFKLSFACESFPVNFEQDLTSQLAKIKQELKTNKLGLNEVNNRYLVRNKPIQIVKFVPLEKILLTANPTGMHGIDSNKPTLPGMEVPLPNLGISALKLKSLLKHGQIVNSVSRKSSTIIINSKNNELIRLTGGNKNFPSSWVHSKYQLNGAIVDLINKLSDLSQDKRFGIKIKEVQPFKFNEKSFNFNESMQLD